MNECFEHRIQWQGETIEFPLCRIDNLIANMSNDKTMYYGFEVAAFIKQAYQQDIHADARIIQKENYGKRN